MINRHITKILDNTKFTELSTEQKTVISAHVLECNDCRAAFQSAQIASILLIEKSNVETFVPEPIFQAKVLNAWHAKQNASKPFAAFWRWWQASAALVSMMILIVAGLMIATFISSRHRTAVTQNIDLDAKLYTTENVIMNEKPTRSLTTDQIFELLDNNY